MCKVWLGDCLAELIADGNVAEIHDMWKTRGEEDGKGEGIVEEPKAEMSKLEAKG